MERRPWAEGCRARIKAERGQKALAFRRFCDPQIEPCDVGQKRKLHHGGVAAAWPLLCPLTGRDGRSVDSEEDDVGDKVRRACCMHAASRHTYLPLKLFAQRYVRPLARFHGFSEDYSNPQFTDTRALSAECPDALSAVGMQDLVNESSFTAATVACGRTSNAWRSATSDRSTRSSSNAGFGALYSFPHGLSFQRDHLISGD